MPAGKRSAGKAQEEFRFRPGDPVRTRQDEPPGHCRTPFYLRGQPGVVERRLGHFRNPQELAYGGTGLPKQALYQVRYALPGLWGQTPAASRDSLLADIYEFWLEPA